MRWLILLLAPLCVGGQPVPRNRLTFSGGWSRDIGGLATRHSATGLGGSYGYRLARHLEAEGGVFVALDPTGDICSAHGCVDVGDRFLWVPVGLRFIAPAFGGRVELSIGGGGLAERYTIARPFSGVSPYSQWSWGGYFVASAAVALDRGKHVWLGATPRWFLANPPYDRHRWFQFAGEISFRFR